ncbi:MAG: Dipicolinate synthase subunit A [Firmicutes bacterium]|nr:Dipicolinate synthase subunit A [candidate division NPL-UPA2 bacterium]
MSAVLAGLTIGIVGGDRRTEYYLPSLLQAGAKILATGLARLPGHLDVVLVDLMTAIRSCHVVLLPMAGMDTRGSVQSYYDDAPIVLDLTLSSRGLLVLTGVARPELQELGAANGWRMCEIGADDELAYLNSVPTAEGAVRLAQDRAVKTIHGSRALVVGYGRCGITLAALLKGMGAHVTVAARQPGVLAKAFAAGHSPHYVGELSRVLGSHDFLFNAAPALVFTEELLVCMRRDSVLIDIASGAGGVDYQAAKRLGCIAVLAPSLPGKVYARDSRAHFGPGSAAHIIENLPEER